ncbi:MAG: 3-deoxy-manno-octulosonate cytidylyltransferase [Cystobacterineae bacterium]|nr:3-deoxy-manno-octulosonate cytidylyltransferase [Cystobacterineae bacterium]
MPMPPAIAIIPARFASRRFPGKPLALLLGKPMLQHVFQRCQESGIFQEVYIATEDQRIAQAAAQFGAKTLITSASCLTGTERIAQALEQIPCSRQTLLVNVQGDEPALPPEALRHLVQHFEEGFHMATLVRPLQAEEATNPNVVKVAFSSRGRALYFSRALIPYAQPPAPPPQRWAHMGLYAYRKAALLRMAQHPPSLLEQSEALEQLRALEMGLSLLCIPCAFSSVAVDSPDDLPRAEMALQHLKLRPRPC